MRPVPVSVNLLIVFIGICLLAVSAMERHNERTLKRQRKRAGRG